MGGPAEHSSSSNSVVGQNLHLPPASAIPASPESPERPRGRKRTRTQVSPKSTSFYFLLKDCVATACGSGFITSCQPESTSTLPDAPDKSYQEYLWRKPVYLGRCHISQKVHRLLSKPMLSPQVRLFSLCNSGIPSNLPLCSLREICERIAVKVRYLY